MYVISESRRLLQDTSLSGFCFHKVWASISAVQKEGRGKSCNWSALNSSCFQSLIPWPFHQSPFLPHIMKSPVTFLEPLHHGEFADHCSGPIIPRTFWAEDTRTYWNRSWGTLETDYHFFTYRRWSNSGVIGDWNCFNLGVQKNAEAGNQTGKWNWVWAGRRG